MIESLQIHLREEAIRIAGQAIMDFTRQEPALNVVPVKPGVNLMAKRILRWDAARSYKTSTGSFRCSFFWKEHPNSILISEHHDLRFHSIAHDTIKNRDIILRKIAGG